MDEITVMNTAKYDMRVRLRYLRFRLWWIPFRKPAHPRIVLGGKASMRFCGEVVTGRVTSSGKIGKEEWFGLDFDADCYSYVDDDGNELDEPTKGRKAMTGTYPTSFMLWGYQKY